ncbi:MAG TPA: WYL domain-containing protein [Gemmatimonadota bacterium]|nr:WYL domain-containing protein [Gemmatimonadota bacterium]
MSARISKVQRWLDLISFLVGHRFPVDVDEVMRHVPAYAERWASGSEKDRASVRRMFERDKDELRDLGVPLESVHYSIDYGMERAEGYRLARRDFYLPYLRLLRREGEQAAGEAPVPDEETASPSEAARQRGSGVRGVPTFDLGDDEAVLALEALDRILERDAFPLRDDARAARRKLAFDLDADALSGAPVLWVDPPGAEERRGLLDDLSDALMRRKRVRFGYRGIHRDERTERDVEPWGLLFQHSHWYLVGRDRNRDARRTFRVARMEGVEVSARSPHTPDYELPADFELAELRGLDAWELGDDEPLEARVLFEFPRSLWADRNGVGSLVRGDAGGAQLRAFRVVQPDPFLRWILSLASEARIVDPPELVRAFREMAAAVAALYGGGGTAGSGADRSAAGPAGDAPGPEDDPDGARG